MGLIYFLLLRRHPVLPRVDCVLQALASSAFGQVLALCHLMQVLILFEPGALQPIAPLHCLCGCVHENVELAERRPRRPFLVMRARDKPIDQSQVIVRRG